MKSSKNLPKHFIFVNLDSYYVTDTLLQEPLLVPNGAVAILQIWLKENNSIVPIQCYLNDNAERIEAGSKNCSAGVKYRIDNWLHELKTTV